MKLIDRVNESIAYIREKVDYTPQIGLVLGSGLGDYADTLKNKIVIPYSEIPHFYSASVAGHKGNLVFGEINGKKVVCQQGRNHYYEGIGMDNVTYPIRVMKKLGVEILFTTNATGGLNENFKVGDYMIITDHINYMGQNPLIGENEEEFGPRFPDLSNIYTKELVLLAEKAGEEIGIKMQKGVMGGYSGPNYETPAEIRMLKMFGCDNVGMSTIPETIVARHSGMKVLSISSITNMAAGISKTELSHEEVSEVANNMVKTFKLLVDKIIEKM